MIIRRRTVRIEIEHLSLTVKAAMPDPQATAEPEATEMQPAVRNLCEQVELPPTTNRNLPEEAS